LLAAWGGTEDAARKRRRCTAWPCAKLRIPFQLCADPRPEKNAAADGIGGSPPYACPRVRVKLRAGPRVGGAPQGGARFEDHGPRTAMRSAATTMLRLAALHLPSPLDFQARRFAKLMRGGAMSGLRVAI